MKKVARSPLSATARIMRDALTARGMRPARKCEVFYLTREIAIVPLHTLATGEVVYRLSNDGEEVAIGTSAVIADAAAGMIVGAY